MARIASFHLIRERRGRAPLAMARLGTDRLRLRNVAGLAFWRLMGTGSGSDTGPGIDARRTAMFAVWDDEADLDRFLADHHIPRRWRSAEEHFDVRLRFVSGHGQWRGFDVLDGLETGTGDGPMAVITRADVRRRSWREFGRAGREVDDELHDAEGLIDVVGIGEAPVGRLATFSLWASNGAIQTYAFASPRHLQVIEQTRAGDWYREELFARFEPFGASGTWNGRNPLAEDTI